MNEPRKMSRATSKCPVCGAGGYTLLSLPASPIYLHPVPTDAVIEQPHTVDLRWLTCGDCAHAWQPHFDATLLERIYQNHYYTPAPGGFAIEFRNDFLLALRKFGIEAEVNTILEIGASDGDVLDELRTRLKAKMAYAFEPNVENAAIAQRRGLDVRREFFGRKAITATINPADFVYARHVIEHIFDFPDFFSGLNAVSTMRTKFVLETPSLDFHVKHCTLDPFHIEHIHVFSLRSLAKLAYLNGWSMLQHITTQDGNLIVLFERGLEESNPPAPDGDCLQRKVEAERAKWKAIASQSQLLFWGAGSCGVTLANLIGREPDAWTDGNPAKIGKQFAGLRSRIVTPQEAFAMFQNKASSEAVFLVIASSFAREILPKIIRLGWKFGVLDSRGNRIA